MRALVLSLSLLVVILFFSWYTITYLDTSSKEMLSFVNSLEQKVAEENWPSTGEPLDKIDSFWRKTEKKWTMVLDHRETDEIELTLARLKSYIESQELGSALAELSALRFLLEHIPGKERFLLRNVF